MPFYRIPIKTAGLLLLFWLSGSLIVAVTLRVLPVQAAPTELFFSEYIEGTSNNKALEIFNGTGASIDLAAGGYDIQFFFNGSATAGRTIALTGVIAANDVYVLAHSSAVSTILGQADQTAGNPFFNGNDAIVLRKNGVSIDVIGVIGSDPGTEWGTGLTSTADNTLRRKASIEAGDINGSDAFDPAAEWDGFAQDTFDGLGTYLIPTPTPTPTATSTSTFTPIPATDTPTLTPTPTDTSTPIPPTDTPTFTPVATDTPTVTDTPTSTFTPIPADTPTATVTTTETVTPAVTLTVTATAAVPTGTPIPTSTPAPPAPGDVVINEVVTDPQQDWSSNGFNGIPIPTPSGTITDVDEYIELYVKTTGLNLTGWTIELLDASPPTVPGMLATGGAFQVSRYVGTGSFTNTVSGDYLILGDVKGSGGPGSMNNDILIVLKDASGMIIDKVELGSDPENDGTGDGAPDGTGRGGDATDTTNFTDEAVIRYPNGMDTDNDVDDFIVGKVTMGSNNDPAVPPPLPPGDPLLISEFLYDGTTPSTEGDEFVEFCNPVTTTVNLEHYKIGDEETIIGDEMMYKFPITATIAPNTCQVVAKNAVQFQARFNRLPDYEVIFSGSGYTDHADVPNLAKYSGSRSWSLANDGDELVVLGPNDQILDSVAYRNGNYTALSLEADASAPEPLSLQRVWPTNTNSMPNDFVRTDPNPGQATLPPLPPATILPPAALPDGMYAYWGDLHAHSSYSDGSGPPHYALAMARAAGLHFQAITDHDWWLNSLEWFRILTQTTNATVPGQFVALRGVEWTDDTAGHINVFNTTALLNSRTDPMFSSLPDFYSWLAAHPEVIAQFNHPDPSYGGTFFNFAYHSAAAQVMFMQEIGNNAQSYTTYEPSFVQSNMAGWRVAPTNNSDHHQAHWGSQSTARTGLVAPALTEGDLLAAIRARRVFATEDSNLAVALRLNGAWMGSSLSATGPLPLTVDVIDPDAEPLTLYLYDSNLLLSTVPLAPSTGQWSATVQARPGHFFWAKVVQADGNTAYTAPVWIEGQAALERLVINEILPAPYDWDWDGDGQADYRDEWIELYNPTDQPVGLGGWQVADSSGAAYNIPLAGIIPVRGFAVFYRTLTGFSLNNDAETVTLTHPNGTVVDTFTYNHSPGYDESYCRLPDAGTAWSDNCAPSPQAANGEKVPAGPLTSKIFDAKHLADNAWVRVKGHITAPPGLLAARTMYIQDNTSGIKVYLPKDHRYTFALGDRVEVVGHLRTFHEEFEIVVTERGDIKFLEHSAPLPPLPIATTSLLEPYEGMLAMLQGQAVDFKGRTTLWVDDGTGPAKTYILKTTGINKPFINRGDPLTMVGIVSQYSAEDDPSRNDYRLLPRYQSDLVVAPAAPAPANWPALLPETGY